MYKSNSRLDHAIYYKTQKEILALAREKRKRMTPAERMLWSRIRKKKCPG